MSPPSGTQTIHLEYNLTHPPAKVWRALTEPKLLAAWLRDNDMRAEVGHRFTFRMQPMPGWDGVVHCEVLELEPHKRLRYSWCGGPAFATLDTVLTWTLTPTSSGTRLTLEHSGFLPIHPFAFAGARKGWEQLVGERLVALLERSPDEG